ncbi:hypothetical protein CI109_103555 [Kwoniella shandongensis]|uniref:Uncharacterized protein n=1 Tax=Kwoniella shandongensis TaxID=1734106 RepID=A0A5M6BVW8_9TREE|nr:uncharacterized protein CI109_004543 [Kwoniella shandongensis]KAA5527008.1 hypothetical protein CI109_004543 [Kwoniella shandongensis]
MSGSFAPPSGPPPPTATGSTASAAAPQPTDDNPFDPPPAYTPSAAVAGEMSVAAGPSRMDFSGPPPMPDRLQHNITGVGVGYGPTHHGSQPQQTGGWGSSISSQSTGFSQPNSGFHPPPPPRHPSTYNSTPPNAKTDTPSSNYADAGPSRPPPPPQTNGPIDLSPTEVPTPGRPLLYKGQLLVYPKGFFCYKCGNTGYKANDPSNPHETDWRKYGKPYNSALSHSFAISTNPSSNPSTISSSNFQRPLPTYNAPPPQIANGNIPPPPPSHQGKWNTYPGQMAPPPPPPPPMMMHPPPPLHAMPGQQIFVQATAGPVPPGALVVGPGDPRIGGRLCWRCSGSGREISFFGFDDGRCYECRGLGRLF